jgi:hypothetical protein
MEASSPWCFSRHATEYGADKGAEGYFGLPTPENIAAIHEHRKHLRFPVEAELRTKSSGEALESW